MLERHPTWWHTSSSSGRPRGCCSMWSNNMVGIYLYPRGIFMDLSLILVARIIIRLQEKLTYHSHEGEIDNPTVPCGPSVIHPFDQEIGLLSLMSGAAKLHIGRHLSLNHPQSSINCMFLALDQRMKSHSLTVI